VKVALDSEPSADWDEFVDSHPDARLAHARVWGRIFEQSYRLRPVYAHARSDGGELRGILPFATIRSLSGRRALCSLPFLDTGGLLAVGPEAEAALLDAALGLARRDGHHSLELRQVSPLTRELAPSGPAPRVDLALRLCEDEPSQWSALGSKVRNQTRKAEREHLVSSSGQDRHHLDAFYRVYARNMRDLGSPPHARTFFAAIADAFGPQQRFIVAKLHGRPVGGLVAIHYAGRVIVPWASTLREERHRCPNNLIYWEAIRWALSLGAHEFDFGRSPPQSGTYRFKRGWGAEERPLWWTRLTPDGTPLTASPWSDQSWLQPLTRLWSYLPVSISTWTGARLRPHLAQ